MRDKNNLFSKLFTALYKPVDSAGLAIFRIYFGAIILYECWRGAQLLPVVREYHYRIFHFKYRFFDWVEPIGPDGMQWLFIIYGIAGLCILLGVFYRIATLAAALIISYIFLVDVTSYLNHIYLVIIMSFMMVFIPAHKGWSLYAWFKRKQGPALVPEWAYWLLRFQIGVVYFYGALAKMNVDWINGMPLYNWLADHAEDFPAEAFIATAPGIYFFSYMGILYDLLVVPLLLYRPTRAIAYMMTLSFHVTNFHLFNIGIFPWFMIGATTIFFAPSWPRDLLNFFFPNRFRKLEGLIPPPKALNFIGKAGLALMVVHVSFQTLFPLRHFAYETNPNWSEEGHNYSWHMKLRGKTSTLKFVLVDPETKREFEVDPRRYLSKRQTTKMSGKPALILQFAHFLRDTYTLPGHEQVEVYAVGMVKLNGRKAQRLVDPTVNLANIRIKEFHNEWVFPIRQPVWNAHSKVNRFGPALKKDDIAYRAIPELAEKAVVDNR